VTEPRHDRSTDAAAKDTRDSSQLPVGTSTLDSGVRDLLAAIRDALDMPYPVTDDAGRGLQVVMNRAAVVQGALEAILGGTAMPENAVVPIRNGIARHPITYTVPGDADGGDRP
jgi:hypothetical protein